MPTIGIFLASDTRASHEYKVRMLYL